MGKPTDINDYQRRHGVDAVRGKLDRIESPSLSPGRDTFNQDQDGLRQKSTESASTKRLLQTVSEFLAAYVMPEYVVDGLMQRGFFYSITAMTGAGKSAVALLIAVIASDRKVRRKLGQYQVEHCQVVYIAAENSEDIRRRLIGMEAKMGFNRADLDMLIIDKVIDIEKEMPRILREIEEFGSNVGLVFVDTSAAVFPGDDENNSPQMLAYAKTQRSLCKLPGRPTTVALCHPTKHVDRPELLLPRGGGSYLAETDGNFTLWAHDERMTRLHWAGKLRGPDFEPIEFRLPTIHTMALVDAKGRLMPTVMAEVIGEAEITEVEERGQFQEDRLLRAMFDRPGGSLSQWAIDCGWHLTAKPGEDPQPNKPLVQRVLRRLVGYKFVKKEGRGHVLTKEGKGAAESMPKIVSAPRK
jgi:AAA domain